MRQYFYRMTECKAGHATAPDCICWHDEGTGPLASGNGAKSWREKPVQRSSAENAPPLHVAPEIVQSLDNEVGELRQLVIAAEGALEHYAHELCEGWCKDAAPEAKFDDCGGCRARLALRGITAVPQRPIEPTDEMVTAAMRAFEPMSSVLRYREKDKWHSCDIMGMRDALRAALALSRPNREPQSK